MTLLRSRLSSPSPQLIGDHVQLAPPLDGHHIPVQSLAIEGERLFATYHYAAVGNPNQTPAKGFLAVRDRATLAEVAPPVEVGWQPRQVVVNPVARRIYVFNYGAASKDISIIGLDSLQPEGTITIPEGWPVRMAVDEGHNRLYVLTYQSQELIAYDCADHSVIGRKVLGEGLTDLAYDEASRRLFVTRFKATSPYDDKLVVVDTSLMATPDQVLPDSIGLVPRCRPRAVEHHPGLDRVYIMCEGVGGAPLAGPGILEYDPDTYGYTRVVTQGGPVALGLDRFHEIVHLLTHVSLVSYSTAGFAPTQPDPEMLPGASASMAVDPETSTVVVGNDAGQVTLVHPDLAVGEAPHAAASAAPTLVGFDGGMVVAVVGNDDRLRVSRWTEETDWDFGLGWIESPNPVPAGTPLAGISRYAGKWELFYVGDDRQLWRLSGNGDGSLDGAVALGGLFPPRAHVTALSRHEGQWAAFAVGDDGKVFAAGGIGEPVELGTIEPGAHGPQLAPGAPIAAVSRKPDHWDLFVLATDGTVWTTWWSVDDGPGGWGSLGGGFAAGTQLTAATRHRNSLELFAVAPDGNVVTQFYDSQDGDWSGWVPVAGTDNLAVPGSAVGVMCRNEDSIDIFVVRDDHQIWNAGWGQGWSGWRPLGGRAAAAGATVAARPRPFTDQWMHICWVGEAGVVETAWWNPKQPNGGWTLANDVRLRVPTESVHFFTEVETDADSLTGQVHTRFWRDGNFLISGHMHNSGFDPYRFTTQSAVLTENGYSVLEVGTGHLDGTGSDFDPDRDAYWNDVGYDEVIEGAFDELLAGVATANSVSKNIGLGGGLSSIFDAVMNDFVNGLLVKPFHPVTQGLLSLGQKAAELFHLPFLQPQSLITLTGSAGWIVGFGYVLPVLPWYHTVGATDPFVAHRPIEDDEYAFADQVFQGKLPPQGRVFLTDAVGLAKNPVSPKPADRGFVFPPGPSGDGPYLINLGKAYDHPTTYTTEGYETPGQLFIHEMAHAWHAHHTGLPMRKWLNRALNDHDYIPQDPADPWSDFGPEEKAATVDQWFARHIGHGLDSSPALEDPYFKFIHLVRLGVTGD